MTIYHLSHFGMNRFHRNQRKIYAKSGNTNMLKTRTYTKEKLRKMVGLDFVTLHIYAGNVEKVTIQLQDF